MMSPAIPTHYAQKMAMKYQVASPSKGLSSNVQPSLHALAAPPREGQSIGDQVAHTRAMLH